MGDQDEFEKLTLEISVLEINIEQTQEYSNTTPNQKTTKTKPSTPSKKSPKLSTEDEEKLKKIKIEKKNSHEIFKELKEFFSTLKKNYNSNHSEKLKEIFQKYPDFKFSNIFIHSWFKYLYSDLSLSDQQLCYCFNYRTSFVQKMMEDEKLNDEVVDHQAFSAFLKVLFGSLKSSKSCKLYNILFAIFIFNSSINLKVESKEKNSKDAKHEKKVNDGFRKLKPSVTNGKFLYQEYQNSMKEEMDPFLESKLKPSLLKLLPYLKCSSSTCSMIGWAFTCWKSTFDQPMLDWLTSYQTISKKKTEGELRIYLMKREIEELFIISNDEDYISFTNELLIIEMNEINLRLFITLSKSDTIQNINEIIDQFEEL
jgi:hypothetical protein